MAENTLSRYVDGDGPSAVHNLHNLPVYAVRDGKYYPYHQEDSSYLSRFPFGFRGCFKCVKVDH